MKFCTLGYVMKDNKILMLYRNKKINDVHEGKWSGLGGKIEEGESPEEGIIREIYEESGLRVNTPKLRAILTFPNFKNEETWHVFLYYIDKFDGSIKENCLEGDLEWISIDKVNTLNMWEGDKIFMSCIHTSGLYQGTFNYEDSKLITYTFKKIIE